MLLIKTHVPGDINLTPTQFRSGAWRLDFRVPKSFDLLIGLPRFPVRIGVATIPIEQ